jgi:hypothetical protein
MRRRKMKSNVRKSFKNFYIHEKHEYIFEKIFNKYYKRGHWGEMREDLIREQQKDWWEKLKGLIENRDYGSLYMAVNHRKNMVSREMFSKLTGINIKQKTSKIIQETLQEFCITEKTSDFEKLKKNKVELTPEERKCCMDSKATWNFHFGRDGKRQLTPAVWKSVNEKGDVTYICNTHRAYNTSSTMKGAIDRFHKFIKGTA